MRQLQQLHNALHGKDLQSLRRFVENGTFFSIIIDDDDDDDDSDNDEEEEVIMKVQKE